MDINEQFESLMENSTEINEAEEVDIDLWKENLVLV